MWLFLAFVAVPLVEIALFITVGGWIGVWPTLGLVLLSGVVGSWLLRTQGLNTASALQASVSQLSDPREHIAHGALILLAGALLLTPGFFSDIVGLSLLIPGVRRMIIARIAAKVAASGDDFGAGARHRPDIIDAEYEIIEPEPGNRQPPSGWTRH
jgi:UPF0716 protein FxsA